MKTLDIGGLMQLPSDEIQHASFLYPTDSLYGLGGIATLENAQKIDEMKQRKLRKSYSVIAPGFTWIKEHFLVGNNFATQWEERYQQYGPLTILCKRKVPVFLSWVSENEFVGIRIIKHPFQEFVDQLGQPFLSTSANISGVSYTSEALPSPFEDKLDYYIENVTPMTARASTLINYDTKEIIIRS